MAAPKPASTTGYPPDYCAPDHFFTPLIPLHRAGRSRFYRIVCTVNDGNGDRPDWETTWRIGEVVFLKGDARVEVGGPYSFTSAWISAGSGEERVRMSYPNGLTPVHFLRLSLIHGAETVSTNFYMRSLKHDDFRAIRELPVAKLDLKSSAMRKGDVWGLTGIVENTSAWPALMVRFKAVRETSGDRILPVIYSDNYIALMPGESRAITAEVRHADTRGEKPTLILG